MRRQRVAMLLLALMLLTTPVKAASSTFPTPQEAIDRLITLGVIRVTMPRESIDINWSGHLTRAELATVIVRAFGREEAALSAPLTEPPYADVPLDAWYAKYLAEAKLAAAGEGVLLGDGTGRFDPDRPLSRVEALILPLKLIGLHPTETGPNWYSPWIDLADQKGLLTAAEVASLGENPHQPSTRGESLVLLDRLFYARLLPDGESVYTKYLDPVPPTIETSVDLGALQAEPVVAVVGQSVDLAVMVLDQRGMPVEAPVIGTSTLGRFDNGRFTAGDRAGEGQVVLRAGGLTAFVPVTVLPGPLAAAFSRSGAPGQPIPLTAVDAKGNPVSAVRWEAITPGAEVDSAGFFRAQSPGSYQLRVSQPAVEGAERLVTFKVLDPKEELTPAPVAVWREGESWVMALGLFQGGERVAPIRSTHPSEIIPPEPLLVTASTSVTLAGGVDSLELLPVGGLYLIRYAIDPASDSPTLAVSRPGRPAQMLRSSQLQPSEPSRQPERAFLSQAEIGGESYALVGATPRIQGTARVLVTDPANQPLAGVDVVVEAEGEGIALEGSRMRAYRTNESGLATIYFETSEEYSHGRLLLRSAFLGSESVAISNAVMGTAHRDTQR